MFERRLRLFLIFIFLGAFLLAARATQVQVLQRDEWVTRAKSSAARPVGLPARRGDLLDFKGEVIATDVPALEASVNFRVIGQEPDAKWLREEATRRARKLAAWAGSDADGRLLLITQEEFGVRGDLREMWDMLTLFSGKPADEMDAERARIEQSVAKKHVTIAGGRFEAATREFTEAPAAPWYVRLVAGTPRAPERLAFEDKLVISEQLGFHPILSDLTREQYNALSLAQDHFPQYKVDNNTWASVLNLAPIVRREYPFGDVACQVIGNVGPVSKEDRDGDPNKGDKERQYGLIDRIGREGLEQLAEQQLRGPRSTESPQTGQDVRTTIDIKLQRDIQEAFKTVHFQTPDLDPNDPAGHKKIIDVLPMNGAAVVIDIKTGQVRALVSVPTFDLNKFDELYETMADDVLNRPLTNRALLDTIEPGSAVKPIVGLGAVTQKLVSVTDTVECTGYPIINGRRLDRPRCWTMSMYGAMNMGAHHMVPSNARHPTGFLNLGDAIERSCNVYFETQGYKLGLQGLSYWMRQFGFGRATGIGLPEARGLLPDKAKISETDRAAAPLYAAIGQSWVLATPIQVCNEMATIAREGIWQRPSLLVNPPPAQASDDPGALPDRYDLHLDPEGLATIHDGMKRVVNSAAGTGTAVKRDDVELAAKTGSATAAQLTRPIREIDPDTGKLKVVRYELVPYGSHAKPNPEVPWYRMSGFEEDGRPKGTHSWVAGYAPADDPQIAFVAYVEYGSSGGFGAASVVVKMIDACIKHGYLQANARAGEPSPAAAVVPPHLARPEETPTGADH